jgi:DNA/RNA non-specific endonuclease
MVSHLGKKNEPGKTAKGGKGGGTFPRWASDLKPGEVDYGKVNRHGQRSGIQAIVTKAMIGTGTEPDDKIIPPGYGGAKDNHAKGHLLGRQLGGSGDEAANLVTLRHQGCNTPYMRNFENQIRRAVEGGQNVAVRVTPIYEGTNPVPVGITMEAKGDGNPPFELSTSIPNWESEAGKRLREKAGGD